MATRHPVVYNPRLKSHQSLWDLLREKFTLRQFDMALTDDADEDFQTSSSSSSSSSTSAPVTADFLVNKIGIVYLGDMDLRQPLHALTPRIVAATKCAKHLVLVQRSWDAAVAAAASKVFVWASCRFISTVPVADAAQAARIIRKFLTSKPFVEPTPLVVPLEEQKRQTLAAVANIPGISSANAEALMQKVQSIRGLADMEEDKLARVSFMGNAKARKVSDFFNNVSFTPATQQ